MASVRELKDALIAEHHQVVRSSEIAMDAITTMLSLSQWVLGVLGLAIALIALVGLGLIYRIVKRRIDDITNRRLEEHLTSVEFDERIDAIVASAVHAKFQNIYIVERIEQVSRRKDDPSPFPDQETKHDPS